MSLKDPASQGDLLVTAIIGSIIANGIARDAADDVSNATWNAANHAVRENETLMKLQNEFSLLDLETKKTLILDKYNHTRLRRALSALGREPSFPTKPTNYDLATINNKHLFSAPEYERRNFSRWMVIIGMCIHIIFAIGIYREGNSLTNVIFLPLGVTWFFYLCLMPATTTDYEIDIKYSELVKKATDYDKQLATSNYAKIKFDTEFNSISKDLKDVSTEYLYFDRILPLISSAEFERISLESKQ